MAETPDNRSKIEAAVGRARGRWLTSAMVNAGGRWAVLPCAAVALIAIALALTGVHSLFWLLPLSSIGLAGAVSALLLTRWAYARPGASGAPDWTLLLDRALGLNDALPTWLESKGEFRAAMEGGIARRLDLKREKLAIPARRWGALIIVLVLALMPLTFWRSEAEPEPPPQVAKQEARQPEAPAGESPSTAEGESAGPSEDSSGENPADSNGQGGKGDEGEVQKRPDGAKSEGGAGDPPPDVQPKESKDNPQPPPKEGGVGDKNADPTPPTEGEDPDVESNLNHIKPDAGEGDTRTESRSRWVYDPDADKLDGSTPGAPDMKHPGEKAVPRTKVTSRERKLLEDLYKKLAE